MRIRSILTPVLTVAVFLGAANAASAEEAKPAAVFDAVFVNASPLPTSPRKPRGSST